MRLLLVGTDLAPVETGAGAIENLLVGWATELSRRSFDVHVVSAMKAQVADGYTFHVAPDPSELARVCAALLPDAVLLNNRPLWDRYCAPARVVHLFHNYPDAWATTAGLDELLPARSSRQRLAAVSHALADVVRHAVDPGEAGVTDAVAVVRPFVDQASNSIS